MHRIETTPSLVVPGPSPGDPLSPAAPTDDHAHRRQRSRAALNLRGLCPVCGADAERRLTASPRETRETYRCPVDGETVYLVDRAGRRIQVAGNDLRGSARRSQVRGDPFASGFAPLEAAV